MALSDADLRTAWDQVWGEWEDSTKPDPIPAVEARALRAVADAAVADFSEELMA